MPRLLWRGQLWKPWRHAGAADWTRKCMKRLQPKKNRVQPTRPAPLIDFLGTPPQNHPHPKTRSRWTFFKTYLIFFGPCVWEGGSIEGGTQEVSCCSPILPPSNRQPAKKDQIRLHQESSGASCGRGVWVVAEFCSIMAARDPYTKEPAHLTVIPVDTRDDMGHGQHSVHKAW